MRKSVGKKVLGVLLAAVMAFSLAACGSSSSSENSSESADAVSSLPEASDGGKVLNIYCWNEEFKSRLTDHYAGYEEVDGTTGTIGDVTVKWNITPSDDNAYQNSLDRALAKQADAADDDKIDIFLVEADYALKYTDTEYTMNVADLGITDEDTANQYQYTKDVVTDSSGNLKGLSWQGCPGVLIYRRDIAKKVLGTDDPKEVQKSVSDWDTFKDTASKMAEKNYKMTSSVNDSYRVFSNNVTTKWVDENNKIQIDDNIMNWVEMSKEMVDAKETNTYELWSDDWSQGFYQNSNVFCYFGPAWFIDFKMAADDGKSVASAGGWAATEGPQGFFWGGTWICAAAGTDNRSLVADIMKTMTCDETVMTDIVKADNDFVNNSAAMEAMAQDTAYGDDILGGQNPLRMFCNGVESIDLSHLSIYDQGCNEEFQSAMKNYFDGNATLEEATERFYKAVVEKYPELTY